MDTGSYNNVSSQFKSVLDKSAKDHSIDNSEIKKLINNVKTADDQLIMKKIISGDIGTGVNIFQEGKESEYTFSVKSNDYQLNEINDIVNKNDLLVNVNNTEEPAKSDTEGAKPAKKSTPKKPLEKDLKKNIEDEINKIIPADKKEKWKALNKKDKAAVKVFIDELTIPVADKIKLQDLMIKSNKSFLDLDKFKKVILNQDRVIPIDKLNSIPAISKYVLNEFTGVNTDDLEVPAEVIKIIGEESKINKALTTVDQEVVSKVRDADVDGAKSTNKATFKTNSQGVVAGYEKDNNGGTVSTNLKNEAKLQAKVSESANFGAGGNIGNVSSLADSTPANITRFKDIAKTLLIPEKTALKLHDDLVAAQTEKEKLAVVDAFVKKNGTKGYSYLKSLGWIDKSVNLNVNVDGKASVLEIGRQSVLAGFEIAGTGGKAGYNKQTGTVLLRGTMAGKEVEFEVSKENFRTAFGNSKNHAAIQFNTSKFDIDLKGLGQTIQLKIEKGDYRVGGGVAGYEYSFSYKNKKKIEISQFEDQETCQVYNIVNLNTEKGLGTTATLPMGFANIKGGADGEKNLYIKIMIPALELGKELTAAEKERVTGIGKQIELDRTLNVKTVESLNKGEKIIVTGIRKFDIKVGADVSGVDLKGQLDKEKDYKMTVESLGDCLVKVSLEIGADTKKSSEIGISGNTFSGSLENDRNNTMEFECNLNTEKGRNDYQKVLSKINLCTIPQTSVFTPETQKTVLSGDDSAVIKKRGISITIAAFSRTQEIKVTHNPDNTTTIISDSTRKQEDKNIPVIKNIIDDETKITHGKGILNVNKDVSSVEITMEIKDSRVRKREVIKYGNRAGQHSSALSDLKDEKASIKVTMDLNHEKIMKLWVTANSFPSEKTETIVFNEPENRNIEEIENAAYQDFTDPYYGAFDKYADVTKGISYKEAENFRHQLEYSTTDEERLKTVLEFTKRNAEAGFQFLHTIKDSYGETILPVSKPQITGSKEQGLSKELEDTSKKLADLIEKPKHNNKDLRKTLHKFNDIKDRAEDQKDYLNSLKESIDDETNILPSEKIKLKALIDQSVGKVEDIINKTTGQINYLKFTREIHEEEHKSIEEIES
jgi:hypothetical protein